MANVVADRMSSLRSLLEDQPARAVTEDSPAVAVLGSDLRCEVRGPGDATVATAMPRGLGGDGSAPSPGWLLRSAIASCAATTIALRAAEAGVELTSVEVRVDSTSDTRGLLGAGDVRPGLLDARMSISVSAPGADPEELERLVSEADLGSPVGESVRNGVSVTTSITVI